MVDGFPHFSHFSILKHTISHFGAFYHNSVDKLQNLIFRPPDVIGLPPMIITTSIVSKCAIFHYIVELVNAEAKPCPQRSSKDANPIQ